LLEQLRRNEITSLNVSNARRKKKVLRACGMRGGVLDMQLLCEALAANTSVVEVHVANNGVGDAGVARLATALDGGRHAQLNRLSVSGNELTSVGVAALVECVAKSTQLQHFDVSNNATLGDAGVAAVCAWLESNATVTAVNLNATGVTDDGVAAIARMLRVNQTLKVLSLSDNAQLTKPPPPTTTTTTTTTTTPTPPPPPQEAATAASSSGDGIVGDATVDGVWSAALIDALAVNTSLTELLLQRTPVAAATASKIRHLLRRNSPADADDDDDDNDDDSGGGGGVGGVDA
jgi:hypothetical protein